LGHIRLGGALLLLSGLADTLDGQVARGGAMVTKFGAFYDSTLDRVGDGATFIGIGAYLLLAPDVAYRAPAVITCMIAILSSLLVSYARARAEGLGLDCKVGIAQRAERVIGLGIVSLLVGAGPGALVLEGAVVLLAIASTITVVQRFVYVHRIADQAEAEPRVRKVERPALDTLAKGH
jgi:CDP-diacylglycerol--glycerol-3-phosphate 3-phosphatidyltransferase